MIEMALQQMTPEMRGQLKKINEFLPMVKGFHDLIPIEKDKGELGVAYLIRFEEKGIILYQVALASKPAVNNGKPFVSRQLNKWDLSQKLEELTKNL